MVQPLKINTCKGRLSDDSTEAGSSNSLEGDSPEPPPPKKRLAKFLKKTSMCKHYQRGHCRFRDKCSYAHEVDELMTKPDLTKTRICVYFLAGCCTNNNCSYAHDLNEVQQSNASHTKSQALSAQQRKGSNVEFISPMPMKVTPRPSHASLQYQYPLEAVPWQASEVTMDVHELLLSMGEVTSQKPVGQLSHNPPGFSGRNGQTLKAGLQPGFQPKLIERGRDEQNGWQQQVAAQNHTPKEELQKWLHACEHAEQLSATVEHEIAQLFLSDSRWAAIFPRLSQQCMCRLADHLQTVWQDSGQGNIYSV